MGNPIRSESASSGTNPLTDPSCSSDGPESSGREERTFLHDLVNPMAIAYGMIDALLDEAKTTGSLNEAQVRRLEKASQSMARMKDLISQRRARLVDLQTKKVP